MTVVHVFLERIQPNPFQTRLGQPDPDYITELALDINANTLLQPAMGRIVDSSGWPLDWADDNELLALLDHENVFLQLAFGHNRLAAFAWLCQQYPLSGYSKLPVDIRPLSNEQMADYAWSENERRLAVNPYERYRAVQMRMDVFEWTQEQAAEHLRLSRSTVSNILRIGKLPEGVLDDLRQGHLAERAALSLLPLYELPQSFIDHAEANLWSSDCKPSSIIADARSGLSSETIRERIVRMISGYSINLQTEAEWQLDEEIVHNDVHSLACRGCPMRMKERNACLDPVCFETKKKTYRAQYLYLAQGAYKAATNRWIAIAEDDINPGVSTNLEYEGSDVVSALAKSGCENLRLTYSRPGYVGSRISPASLSEVGYPNAVIFCMRRSGHCNCKKGLEHLQKTGRADEPHPFRDAETAGEIAEIGDAGDDAVDTEPGDVPDAETITPPTMTWSQLQEMASQAHKDKIMYRQSAELARSEAIEIITDLLLVEHVSAWRALAKHLMGYRLKDDQMPETARAAAELIAREMIFNVSGYWDDREIPSRLNQWLSSKDLPEVTPPTLMDIFGDDESETE